MCIQALFTTEAARRARQPASETTGQTTDIDPTMPIKRRKSDRFASQLCKILCIHRDDKKSTRSVNIPTTPVSQPKRLHRFSLPGMKKQLKVASPSLSPPISPPTVANSQTLSTFSYTSANSSIPQTSLSTSSTTPSSNVSADQIKGTTTDNVYETAMAGLRAAEKLLEQRHAAIKAPAVTRPQTRRDTLTNSTSLECLANKPRKKATNSKGTTVIYRHVSRQQKKLPDAANEACDALQRRKFLKDLAYRGVNGCEHAIAVFGKLNEHLALQNMKKEDDDGNADLTLNFDGIHVHASQLGSMEHTWIARFNAMRKLENMVMKKRLGSEDYEEVLAQLFPNAAKDLLVETYFDIFVTGLGIEGILTTAQAKSISSLGVSKEEFEAGASWSGKKNENKQYMAENIAIFDIPMGNNAFSSSSAHHQINLSYSLRILTDYGIVRAVRGTFIRIAGQAYRDSYDLSAFLYHRVPASGLCVSVIPQILALHPEYDEVCIDPAKYRQVTTRLGDAKRAFEQEEEARMKEIEACVGAFENLMKREMGVWKRAKRKVGRWWREKEDVVPFDPFAEQVAVVTRDGL